MMNIKRKIHVLLLAVVVCLFFTSCSDELYENTIKEQQRKIKITNINVKDLIKSKDLLKSFTDASKKLKTVNTLGKLTYNSDLGYFVDDENMKMIDYEGYKTLTAQIYKTTDIDEIENLYIHQNPDGSYKAYIFKYDFSEEDVLNFTQNLPVNDLISKTMFRPLDNQIETDYTGVVVPINGECYRIDRVITDDEGQVWVTLVPCYTCSCGVNTNVQTIVEQSGGGSSGPIFNLVYVPQPGAGSNPGDYNPQLGGSSSGNNSNIITHPVINQNRNEIKFIQHLASLPNQDLYNWWYFTASVETTESIKTFFALNGYTDENEDFVENVINQMLLNPLEFTSIKPLIIEEQIDDSLLDPCPKGVFQEVKNTTNNDFAKVLTKLGADSSVYNTTMVSAVAPNGRPAQTTRSSAFNYKIYISTNYVDKTKLFIAASMLHELVHAYFMSLFDDFHNGNPPNPNAYDDFPILFQKYVDKTYPNSSSAAHHEQMALLYVDAIASALQEYQPGLPQQVYDDLAWGGLEEAPIFNTLFPLGSIDRNRINNRYSSESINNTYGYDNPPFQTPVGQPCN